MWFARQGPPFDGHNEMTSANRFLCRLSLQQCSQSKQIVPDTFSNLFAVLSVNLLHSALINPSFAVDNPCLSIDLISYWWLLLCTSIWQAQRKSWHHGCSLKIAHCISRSDIHAAVEMAYSPFADRDSNAIGPTVLPPYRTAGTSLKCRDTIFCKINFTFTCQADKQANLSALQRKANSLCRLAHRPSQFTAPLFEVHVHFLRKELCISMAPNCVCFGTVVFSGQSRLDCFYIDWWRNWCVTQRRETL